MRMPLSILLLFLLFSVPFAGAQQTVQKDSTSALYYFLRFQEYEYQDTMWARVYSDSGLYYAYRAGIDELKGQAHQFKGWYLQDCSRFRDANEEFYKSLAFQKKAGNQQGIADAYGNLGNSYLDMNEFRKSLDYQQLSLSVNSKIIASKPDKESLRRAEEGRTYALHNIAAIFQEIGLYDKALEYEYRSVRYELKSGNSVGVAISYNTLGTLYKKMNKADSAEYYFRKALHMYRKHEYPIGLASALDAYAFLKGARLTESQKREMILESLKIRRELGDVDGEMKLLLELGTRYFDKLSNDSLSSLLKTVYPFIGKGDLSYLAEDYYRLYSRYNSRIGNYDSAYFALENFLELKAISDARKHTNDLVAKDIRYQWKMKNYNDSLLMANSFAQERLKDEREINRQQNVIYLSVIGLIIVLVSLVFFVQSNRRSQRMNDMLSEKNRLINEQKDLVEERNRSISDSINYARRLQTAILPTPEEIDHYLPDNFLFFKPKDVVSGDFHWLEVRDDVIFVAAADCTGHGVPGAMVSVVCSTAMNQSVNELNLREPAQILNKTRDLVIERFEKSDTSVVDGMDIVLCALSRDKRKLIFAGANNPLWIVRRNELLDRSRFTVMNEGREVSLIEIKGDKQPVGQYAKMEPFTQTEIELFPGDCVYLSTDGFADQFGGKHGKKFKYSAFRQLLTDMNALPMERQRERLEQEFYAWKGELEQVDDLCVIGFRV